MEHSWRIVVKENYQMSSINNIFLIRLSFLPIKRIKINSKILNKKIKMDTIMYLNVKTHNAWSLFKIPSIVCNVIGFSNYSL